MRSDIGVKPGALGDRFRAHLLRDRDAVRFESSIGVIRYQAHKQFAGRGKHENLRLPRRVRAQHLYHRRLGKLVGSNPVVKRNRAWSWDAKRRQLGDVMLGGRDIAAGPTGYDEGLNHRRN